MRVDRSATRAEWPWVYGSLASTAPISAWSASGWLCATCSIGSLIVMPPTAPTNVLEPRYPAMTAHAAAANPARR